MYLSKVKTQLIGCSVYIFPIVLWVQEAGNPFFYLFNSALPGQQGYILSKFAGFMALYALGIQAVLSALQSNVSRFSSIDAKCFHRFNGVLFLIFISLHIASFITATSIRGGHFTYAFLLPNFSGYYESMITVGLFTFIVALLLIASPLFYKYIVEKKSNVFQLHKLSIFLVFGATWHAIAIGSETRSPINLCVIGLFNFCVIVQAIGYLKGFATGYKNEKLPANN